MSIDQEIRLTSYASCAGCAAKIGPGTLAEVVRPLSQAFAHHPQLLVGLDIVDDAAVYQINDQQAIISTTDFFPPVVDDAYAFGAIAAANALSDVYAMGGQPLMALNLVAWPDAIPTSVLAQVLQGGADVVARANAVIAGGHSVTDPEPKYGLAVTGMVHPERIFTKGGAQPGDLIVLSKPLGTGLLTTAQKRDLVQEEDMQTAIRSMMTLNRRASERLQALGTGVHAVTDVTGFSLLGHAREMAQQSQALFRFSFSSLPILTNALSYAEQGCIPGGTGRNASFLQPFVRFARQITEVERALLFDPQTSGGLLAAIDPALWPRLAEQEPESSFWLIGEVLPSTTSDVTVEVY